MTTALIIAAHHLHRILRSPGLILILVAVPLTLAGIEYAAFGPTVASGKLPPIKILVLDEDKTFLSGAVPEIFTGGGPLRDMFETSPIADRAAGRTLFQKNEASGLVIVPQGFQDAVLAGHPAELQFAPNPLQTYSPAIAAAVLDMAAVLGNGIYSQAAAPLQRINAARVGNRAPTADEVAEIARGFFEAGQRLRGLTSIANLTVTTVRPTGEREGPGGSPQKFFAYIFPGLVIFGVMFLSQSLALRLMRDRVRGVERRLTMAPVSAVSRIAGSFLFMTTGLFAILGLLMLVGVVVFGITLHHPLTVALLAAGFSVFASALHMAIISASRNERSASFLGSGLIMMLSLLGGTFFPADVMPPFLRRVAFVMPNGAAQQGFIDVLAQGRTLADVSARVVTTWGWALATLALALLFARRREGRA